MLLLFYAAGGATLSAVPRRKLSPRKGMTMVNHSKRRMKKVWSQVPKATWKVRVNFAEETWQPVSSSSCRKDEDEKDNEKDNELED